MELYYKIKGKNYPKLIMGCDSFLREPFVSSCNDKNKKKYILSIMEVVYSNGIIGIHVNIDSQYVFQAFRELKKKHNDVIGIGDPNMNVGFLLGGKSLKNNSGRVIRTIYEVFLNEAEKESIKNNTEYFKKYFFNYKDSDRMLNQDEISSISLRKNIWKSRLKELSPYCEFCLFGANYADWLLAINRKDIIEYEIETIMKAGMFPVSVCHWGSRTLDELVKNTEVVAHWVFANKNALPIIFDDALRVIKRAKNITAFRILRNFNGYNTIDDALSWSFNELSAKSVVIGAPTDITTASRLFAEVREKIGLIRS